MERDIACQQADRHMHVETAASLAYRYAKAPSFHHQCLSVPVAFQCVLHDSSASANAFCPITGHWRARGECSSVGVPCAINGGNGPVATAAHDSCVCTWRHMLPTLFAARSPMSCSPQSITRARHWWRCKRCRSAGHWFLECALAYRRREHVPARRASFHTCSDNKLVFRA